MRFVSAFLFALVLLFFGAVGVWWWTMKKAEDSLNATLDHTLGGQVKYERVSWKTDPQEVRMTLHNIVLDRTDRRGRHYQYHLDRADVRTDFLQAHKLVVHLPSQQVLTVTEKGKTETFLIYMNQGRFLFMSDEQGGLPEEFSFVFDGLRVLSKDSPESLVRLKAGLLEYEPGFNAPHITFGVDTLELQDVIAKETLALKSLSFDVELHNLPPLSDLLLPLVTKHWYPEAKRMSLAALRSAVQYGGKVYIRDWRQVWEGRQIAMHGQLMFDRGHRLSGDLSLTANKKDLLLSVIQQMDSQLVRVYDNTVTKMFKWWDKDKLTGSLSFAHGRVLYDGKKVGEAPVLTKVLELD